MNDAQQWIDNDFEKFISATCEIASIPAPTFEEGPRARWVADRMDSLGLADVQITPGQSAIGRIVGAEPGVVVAAHTDTVFSSREPHDVRREEGRLAGPGVGDNSVGVAAMLEVASILRRLDARRSIWFAATSCEEGLGDLAGVRELTDVLAGRIGCFVALEGHFLGRICTVAIGSRRWRIEMHGSGGHSWHDFGAPSAVHAISELGAKLGALPVPAAPRTTINVGRVEGGEGVNVIARDASLELDLRSESPEQLDTGAHEVQALSHEVAAKHQLELHVEKIGDRPAAALTSDHPLLLVASEALRCVGLEPHYEGASTDANVPASLGIPSLCVGVTRGGGMHTPGEWIEEAPARLGMQQLTLLAASLIGIEAK